MSTISGFLIGFVTVGTLVIVYGDELGERLSDAVEKHPVVAAAIEAGSPKKPDAELPVSLSQTPADIEIPVAEEQATVPVQVEPTLEQRWADYAALADSLEPLGEFRWRNCFQRAAASHQLPESLLLAIASGESNFDPAARSHKDAIGLMQIRWPGTSRHLGVLREADLYDPCTNVDAGARYLAELAAAFNNNLHLVVAAYNYGPARITADALPEGAQWYSQYIYQHLQQVLGKAHTPSSELIRSEADSGSGYQMLMTFNQPYRARNFLVFLREQLPELNLQQRSEALGQYEVVLIYQNETQRQQAVESINAIGITGLSPLAQSSNTL